jgi:exopolysaccharide biosynthesis polyprenyl glycosylphosphotransferase
VASPDGAGEAFPANVHPVCPECHDLGSPPLKGASQVAQRATDATTSKTTDRVIRLPVAAPAVRRQQSTLYRWMAVTDSACMVAALLAAHQLCFGLQLPPRDFLLVLALAPVITGASHLGCRLYQTYQYTSVEEFRRIILSVTAVIMAIVVLSFWTPIPSSRLWIASAWCFALVLTGASRRRWHHVIRHRWTAGQLTFDTLIVGTNREAQSLAELLAASRVGYRPLGFVATAASDGVPPDGPPVLGAIGGLRQLISKTGASCVFVASTAVGPDDVKNVLKARRLDGVEIRVTANFPGTLSATRVTPQSVGGLLALSVQAVRLTRTQAIAKRTFDVVLSAAGLVLAAPLLAAIALAVNLETPGPVLFRQERVGLHRQRFKVLKFRTMVVGAELMLAELAVHNEADGPLFKLRNDPRVTRVGRFLRRYSLDELPQLWNVLKGEMSLVGPRPPLPKEVDAYEDWQMDRLEVRPGITGLWQVSGRSELPFDEYVRLDLFYIENWSLAYDLFILAKTVPMMLAARGAY